MAGTVGDIVQIGVEQLRGTVTMRNVFYYRVEDVPTAGYLEGLSTDFQSIILTALAACLTTAYTFMNVSLLNIFSGDVLEDNTPTPAAGTRAISGDQAPTFVAAMILMTRLNNTVRHGRKFISAPLEGDFTDIGLVAPYSTNMAALAALLDDTLTPGGGLDDFRPVIVKRIPYTTPSGKAAYRLPNSQAEMGSNWSYVGTPRVINRITTQNSRKFWRGE